MIGANGATFNGNTGADSINVIGEAVTGGTFDFGTIRGGDGVDTITFGGQLGNSAGLVGGYTGSVNGGLGADSIVFSGNNVISGLVATFNGQGTNNSGGFRIASGDSLVGGFDTIFVSNNDITGGQTQQAGTFGSAGFVFSGYNDAAAGTYFQVVATAGASGSTGGVALGQAIITSVGGIGAGGAGAGGIAVGTGGFIGAVSAGGSISAGNGQTGGVRPSTFILSGGSTLGQIFSAVDSVVAGRGKAAVFNVQNGSAGQVDGFLFVEGGTLTDTIVKFDTNALGATWAVGGGYFSAGNSDGLNDLRTTNTNSGGEIFFGTNVGVG
jgi:hypothetical protein